MEFLHEALFEGAGVKSGWGVGGVVGALLLCSTLFPDARSIFAGATALCGGNNL